MTLKDLIYEFLELIINYAVPVIFGLAVLYFLYGAVIYLKSGGNQEKRKEGGKFMFTAIISLFIMLAIWSIVGLFASFFGSKPGIPQFKDSTPAHTEDTVL